MRPNINGSWSRAIVSGERSQLTTLPTGAELALSCFTQFDVAVLVADLDLSAAGANVTGRGAFVVVAGDLQAAEIGVDVAVMRFEVGQEVGFFRNHDLHIALAIRDLDGAQLAAVNFDSAIRILHAQVAR